jgi:type IV pilus assembly protein PilA
MRGVRRGEKGFTMIELLIVIAILGILAAVVVPNLAGFISGGHVAAANQEVATVETGAMAYYASYQDWPNSSDDLVTTQYISATPAYATYGFDTWGKVDIDDTDRTQKAIDAGINWNATNHSWE